MLSRLQWKSCDSRCYSYNPSDFVVIPSEVEESLARNIESCLDFARHDKTAKRTLVLFCAITSVLAQAPQPTPPPSVVYSVHDPGSIKDYKTNPRIVHEMVNRLVLAATGQSDMTKAWASLVSPNDRIGIKICAAGGDLFTTHHDIVNALVDGL